MVVTTNAIIIISIIFSIVLFIISIMYSFYRSFPQKKRETTLFLITVKDEDFFCVGLC